MSKEIWLSPVLGNNRERLLKRCAEYVSSGRTDRLLYIAASHPLLDLVTEELLDGSTSRGVWGEFPVYLFRGFVRRVLASAVAGRMPANRTQDACAPLCAPRVPIDREELPLRRSLISQILKQLSATGKLKAIRPLVNRDGCVNTIASLIGELERAGKTAEEFQAAIELRAEDFEPISQIPNSKLQNKRHAQIDFDREVALVYTTYTEALARFGLTDEDADQLRALQMLRGEINGQETSLPWLAEIDLLVLDGFFDFTPVQGEIMKCLIPAVPNVIVNLNGDEHNTDIFRPFQSTLDHLTSITKFKVVQNDNKVQVSGMLTPLREKLFNVATPANSTIEKEKARQDVGEPQAGVPALLFECSDRELEIRTIAKEIKRLILTEGYGLSDIALVVRERASYAEAILRVFGNESIPCNLERRVEAPHIPAVRACGKLFQLLKDTTTEHVRNPKASDIAHLIKTNYFRLSPESLEELTKAFDEKYGWLLADDNDEAASAKQRAANRIGRWAPDVLENVIAYVGTELRVTSWIDRALNLIKVFPSPEAAQKLISGTDEPEDAAAIAEDEATPEDGVALDRHKKPSPVHPAAIAWTVLVMRHLQRLLSGVPEEDTPQELRRGLLLLLDQLRFARQINRPFQQSTDAADVPQATLDVRGLESLRRAVAAAVRSFQYASEVLSSAAPSVDSQLKVTLTTFIDEVERCLRSQVLAIGGANRDGLRVLEATDARGLRFRAVFIAGMIEGGFPLRAGRDWLYPHEERQRLQKHGIFLEDISTDTLLKEEHYFYQAACRATERLYLSRPLSTNDGSETVASHYLDELQRALPPDGLKKIQIRSDPDTHELLQASTPAELALELVRQSERHRHRANRESLLPEGQVATLLKRATASSYLSDSAWRRIGIERERSGERFGRFDGDITNDSLRSMLAQHFGPEYVFSASAISTYGNCAFRFFGQRVLKLEPRSEAALDLQAIDAGKLLHDILRRFFEQYRRQYLPALDREELRAKLAATAEQVFKEHARLVPPLNPRIWEIDCEIRKLILDQVLLYELELQEKTNKRGVLPAYFELAFGRASQASDPKSSTEYLKLARPGNGPPTGSGESALFQGQIDRVDLNEREQVAVAYDYKLTQGAKLDDIRTGRQVQIPIYLAALEQIFLKGYELAGGGYYRLRAASGRLNQGLYRAAFADCTHLSYSKSKLDDIEWQRIRNEVRQRVWEFIDSMRGGHFRVKPSLGRLTCKFCDYSAVCRYDTYRISRKRT